MEICTFPSCPLYQTKESIGLLLPFLQFSAFSTLKALPMVYYMSLPFLFASALDLVLATSNRKRFAFPFCLLKSHLLFW